MELERQNFETQLYGVLNQINARLAVKYLLVLQSSVLAQTSALKHISKVCIKHKPFVS